MSALQEYWVEVGDNKYQVIKLGRGQAEQVLQLTKWISKYGASAVQNAQTDDTITGSMGGLAFIGRLMENLTADAVIDLFIALIGCTREEAELYFDIAILIDVVTAIYNKQPAVRRLIDRFFSTPNSEASSAG